MQKKIKRTNHSRCNTQAGFSMIEMLMTAFILAVGILGLSMLQVMSLKASRGSRSLTTAVQVGEAVMDQIEMEGRLSWLNITDSQRTNPTAINGQKYLTIASGADNAPGEVFDINGKLLPPADPNTYYTVTTQRVANPIVGVTGQINDFVVRVDFMETVRADNSAPIHRSVTISRRILHG
ncbi:MAG: prepilin-type N-terminal cleavage/methylation domain-containing protein [Holophagaceae bacterium]|nr:prepilin-type N-terminal cleavage/methylation domain-containing protein [Holophagaceae bacterium]